MKKFIIFLAVCLFASVGYSHDIDIEYLAPGPQVGSMYVTNVDLPLQVICELSMYGSAFDLPTHSFLPFGQYDDYGINISDYVRAIMPYRYNDYRFNTYWLDDDYYGPIFPYRNYHYNFDPYFSHPHYYSFYSYYQSSHSHAIPEPATIGIFAFGAILFAGRKK